MFHEKVIKICEYGRLIACAIMAIFTVIGSIGRVYKMSRKSDLVNAMEEAAETEE